MSGWEWPGFTAAGALLLPLPARDYAPGPQPLRLPECTLLPKTEFHVTVLGRAAGAAVRAALIARGTSPDVRAREIWASLAWSVRRTGDYALLEREPPSDPRAEAAVPARAWSLIELLDLPAMAAFRARLADGAGLRLPAAPPHVTLYVAGDPDGIGVPDAATLRELRVRALSAAELRAARSDAGP